MRDVTNEKHFEHDSTCCTYLGSVEVEETDDFAGQYDLYWCGPRPLTLIARWSSNGPDYYSGMLFGKEGSITPLYIAYHLALAKGLPCL